MTIKTKVKVGVTGQSRLVAITNEMTAENPPIPWARRQCQPSLDQTYVNHN